MPRKPIEKSNEHYYHVVARTNNKVPWPLPKSVVWQIMCRELYILQNKYDLKIAAFVLMNNHYHLLMLTPKEDISKIMFYFQRHVTLRIQKHTGIINRIYGGRYRGCLIKTENYFFNAYRYVYQNPLRANIAEFVESYPYSTKSKYFRERTKYQFEIEDVFEGLGNFSTIDELKWLNQIMKDKENKSIKFGLSKREFKWMKDRENGKEIVVKTF